MIRLPSSPLFVAVALVAFGTAVPAIAAENPSFESLDKNSDGKVSLNEASEHDGLFVAFKSLDKDKDGLLTKAEFSGYQPSG